MKPKTEMVLNHGQNRPDDAMELYTTPNIEHDAALCHAFFQALRQLPDAYYHRKWIEERVAELMKEWGYTDD